MVNNFGSLQEVTISDFYETNPDPLLVTIASWEILFLLVSSLLHCGVERGFWVSFTEKNYYGEFLRRPLIFG